ncbi:sensor histidine kinase [Streptomyces sp. NPDC059917]|uniref:sensor histidine kinase n=1 Tax=Streptomyces sp. NPDC059917 TaxID=3347002 RepID=UPI00364E6823
MNASAPPPSRRLVRSLERCLPAADRWGALLAASAVLYAVLKTMSEPRWGPLADHTGPEIAVKVLAGAALLWRRRHTHAVLLAVMAADLLTHAPLALTVAMGTLGFLHEGGKRVLGLWTLLAAATHVAAVLINDPSSGFDPVTGALTHVLIPVLVGFHTRAHHGLIRTLTAKAARARYEQELLTARVRSEERARIARELHDIVANRVGQMVLCAGALEVSTTDPAAEIRAAEIRATGREALAELREMLGVIRTEGEEVAAPQLTLEDLDQLLDRCREASGVRVERRDLTGGAIHELPRTVQFTAYRVVQEALTNAIRHAPGSPVRVESAWAEHGGAAALRVSVRNGAPEATVPPADAREPSPPGTGYGLLGLRERVKLLGGTVRHGARPDGGFEVTAILPTHDDAHRTPAARRTTEEQTR